MKTKFKILNAEFTKEKLFILNIFAEFTEITLYPLVAIENEKHRRPIIRISENRVAFGDENLIPFHFFCRFSINI